MEAKLKIVMVDDNTDFLFTMETFLARNGFEVETSDDGQKGLELIRKAVPDIILLDVMMETLFSGFELCKQLRMDDNLKDIPIIGISGTPWIIDEGVFDAVLTRPFSIQSLLDVVESNTGHSLSTACNCWRSRGLETPKRPIAARR